MDRPFKDYAYLWNLDKAKGLDHCTTYNNPSSAMRFLHAIVETVRVKTRDIIDSCRFVSLTCDGSMDCCGKEQELSKSYRDSSLLGNHNLAVPKTSTVFWRKPSTIRTMIMYWTNFVALAQTGQLNRRGHAVKEWQTGNHSCQVSCTPLKVMLQGCLKTVTHIRQGHGPVNRIVLSLQTDPERAPASPTFLWCAGYSSAVAYTCWWNMMATTSGRSRWSIFWKLQGHCVSPAE